MYAVVKTGGKQYRVAIGEKLKVEQIPADVGSEITIDQVFMVGEGDAVKIGTPVVAGASVKATVVSHGRHDKIKIFKIQDGFNKKGRKGGIQPYSGYCAWTG